MADEPPGGAGPHLPGPQQPAHPPTQVRGPSPKVGHHHYTGRGIIGEVTITRLGGGESETCTCLQNQTL